VAILWILLAIIGALANAAFYILVKKYIKILDPRMLTAGGFIGGAVLLFSLSALQGIPSIGPGYYPAVAISAFLNIVGLTLIFSALSSSDLSLSMPMLSFTPAFLVGTSYLLLSEVPSFLGMAGIGVIVIGSYVLNISAEHEHFLDPVKSMMRNRGSWYMLIVAFLFAASINYDKIAMLNSDPVFGMAFTLLIIGSVFIILSAFPIIIGRKSVEDIPVPEDERLNSPVSARGKYLPYVIPSVLVAVFIVAESISINSAYTLQIVPYVIAIKRLSIIFMVLYGTIVCREGDITNRFIGAGIMVGGAVIILLFA
jgi:drug/metabolite transporter (DMT)-like permease